MCIKAAPGLIQDPWKVPYQKNGNLTVLEKDAWLSTVKRAFFIQDVKKLGIRGNHAHKETYQLLFPLTGAFELHIDSPNGGWTYTLEASGNEGVIVPPLNWLWIRILRPKTIIGVLCDKEYIESDYLREHGKYEDCIQQLSASFGIPKTGN